MTGSPVSSASLESPDERLTRGTGTASSGSGPNTSSAIVASRHAPKNQTVEFSSPKIAMRAAARKGPTNMPRRNVPPSSDSARAR